MLPISFAALAKKNLQNGESTNANVSAKKTSWADVADEEQQLEAEAAAVAVATATTTPPIREKSTSLNAKASVNGSGNINEDPEKENGTAEDNDGFEEVTSKHARREASRKEKEMRRKRGPILASRSEFANMQNTSNVQPQNTLPSSNSTTQAAAATQASSPSASRTFGLDRENSSGISFSAAAVKESNNNGSSTNSNNNSGGRRIDEQRMEKSWRAREDGSASNENENGEQANAAAANANASAANAATTVNGGAVAAEPAPLPKVNVWKVRQEQQQTGRESKAASPVSSSQKQTQQHEKHEKKSAPVTPMGSPTPRESQKNVEKASLTANEPQTPVKDQSEVNVVTKNESEKKKADEASTQNDSEDTASATASALTSAAPKKVWTVASQASPAATQKPTDSDTFVWPTLSAEPKSPQQTKEPNGQQNSATISSAPQQQQGSTLPVANTKVKAKWVQVPIEFSIAPPASVKEKESNRHNKSANGNSNRGHNSSSSASGAHIGSRSAAHSRHNSNNNNNGGGNGGGNSRNSGMRTNVGHTQTSNNSGGGGSGREGGFRGSVVGGFKADERRRSLSQPPPFAASLAAAEFMDNGKPATPGHNPAAAPYMPLAAVNGGTSPDTQVMGNTLEAAAAVAAPFVPSHPNDSGAFPSAAAADDDDKSQFTGLSGSSSAFYPTQPRSNTSASAGRAVPFAKFGAQRSSNNLNGGSFMNAQMAGSQHRSVSAFGGARMPMYRGGSAGAELYGVSQQQTGMFDNAMLINLVLSQMEYYFSDENLVKDVYFRMHMNDDGFVPLATIVKFNRVKKLTKDIAFLSEALNYSSFLCKDPTHTHVRRAYDWAQWTFNKEARDEYFANVQNNNTSGNNKFFAAAEQQQQQQQKQLNGEEDQQEQQQPEVFKMSTACSGEEKSANDEIEQSAEEIVVESGNVL